MKERHIVFLVKGTARLTRTWEPEPAGATSHRVSTLRGFGSALGGGQELLCEPMLARVARGASKAQLRRPVVGGWGPPSSALLTGSAGAPFPPPPTPPPHPHRPAAPHLKESE
jgi:hypothetical protein